MKKLGLEVLAMSDAIRLLREQHLPPKATVITIDDGWASTFTHMLPVLERHGYPATVYVQTERIDLNAPVADVALRYAIENTREERLRLADLDPTSEAPDTALPLHSAIEKQAALDALDAMFTKIPISRHRD